MTNPKDPNYQEKLEQLSDILRFVECMVSDHNENNHGLARDWIRHIASAHDKFMDIGEGELYPHEFVWNKRKQESQL